MRVRIYSFPDTKAESERKEYWKDLQLRPRCDCAGRRGGGGLGILLGELQWDNSVNMRVC